MAKFHINRKGDATQCRAKTGACPFGSNEQHYSTREEAREAYEKEQSFNNIVKVSSANYKKDIEKQFKTLMNKRAETKKQLEEAFVKRRAPIGYRYDLVISKEEYEQLSEKHKNLSEQADLKAKELRAFKSVPHYEQHFPQAEGLEEAQARMMEFFNFGSGESRFYSNNLSNYTQETLDRYHAGEKQTYINDPLPSDKLLNVLTNDNNGLMSKQQVYSVMIFPEKDLKPVVERLGIENIKVHPMSNGRENGLVYTVKDAYGEDRSFVIYEHRNTDSLIINGRTNWDPDNEDDPLPYAGSSKNDFFAEFGPNEHKQVAETLGFFMKEAQKGELPSDEELVLKAGHRDWKAILSDSVPGFKEWIEEQDNKK